MSRHPQRLGIDSKGELGHGGVAGHRYLVHLGGVDPGLGADLSSQLVEGLLGEHSQPVQRRLVHHGGADARDHVAAERLLLVERRAHRDGRAGGRVEQGRDHRGGAEIEGDRIPALGRVAWFDVDEYVVDYHRGHLEVAGSKHRR
jgi:hypothetical protein